MVHLSVCLYIAYKNSLLGLNIYYERVWTTVNKEKNRKEEEGHWGQDAFMLGTKQQDQEENVSLW